MEEQGHEEIDHHAKSCRLYAAMFFVIGSLRYIPFINDAEGYTLGIFKLEWYVDLLQ